jgi:drug/metabolite transporter (DMT)-like permease
MNQALIVWLILCLIWGTTWIFIKLGLRDLPPITFAGLRFLVAALILWLIVFWRRRDVPRKRSDWLMIAWTGFIAFALNYGLIFWGEQYINSGLAAVLQSTIPVFGFLIAHYLVPAERITIRKMAGVGLGVAGTAVIFYDQTAIEGANAFYGSLALLSSSVFMAYSNVMVKARCRHIDPATLAAGQMMFGIVPLLVLGAIWEGSPLGLQWTRQSVISLGYLALIGSALAFLLYYWLVKRIDVTKTMLISLVTPVIALLIGMLTLSETVSWHIVLGSVLILAGISLIVIERKVLQQTKEVNE